MPEMSPPALSETNAVQHHVILGDAARDIFQESAQPAQALARLFEARLDLDLVRVLPYLLPIRQAVWWGCLCAWHVREQRPAEQQQALEAAIAWVLAPTAAAGRVALTAADRAQLNNAAGCCARAAGAAGHQADSRSPWQPGQLLLAARSAQGAALFAQAQRPATHHLQFATFGLQVARGEAHWEKGSTP